MSSEADVARLRSALEPEDMPPAALMQVLDGVGDEVKDALVRSVALTFDPPPDGRLLSRLEMLRTEGNAADLAKAYLANVGSPDPQARKASLYGLERLEYPAVQDLATFALRDPDDAVLAAACDILLRNGDDPERVRALLEGVYRSRRGDPRYYTTLAVLQARGIGEGPPADGGGGES